MDYKIGYGRPPIGSRFVKGTSGNPGGKCRTNLGASARSILTDPVRVKIDGKTKNVDPYELAFQALFEKAMKGDMAAAGDVIRECTAAGLLDGAELSSDLVLIVPKDWDNDEWHEMYASYGPPPWKGARDGLVPLERQRTSREKH